MIDYEALFSQFNLDTHKIEELNELHRFAKGCHSHCKRIIVTTTITDLTEKKIVNQEVQDAELV